MENCIQCFLEIYFWGGGFIRFFANLIWLVWREGICLAGYTFLTEDSSQQSTNRAFRNPLFPSPFPRPPRALHYKLISPALLSYVALMYQFIYFVIYLVIYLLAI